MPAKQLEIQDDMRFQRRMWTVQRYGWLAMAAIILAAGAGLCGPGPLSQGSAGESPLRVEYERTTRYERTTLLRAELAPAALSEEGTAQLWISRSYLDAFEVRAITPEPEEVEMQSGRLMYTFKAETAGQPVHVIFSLRTSRVGPLAAEIGLADGPSVSFGQLVYS